MKYKYYISNGFDPYTNLAVERCLFEFANENTAILYLWQNDNTIVIGKNQDIYSECRADEFKAHGGKIVRRMSGGGAVYHDLGNLNFSIITVKSNDSEQKYLDLILRMAKNLGIKAEFGGRNDVVCSGRKFSGSAVYDGSEKVCRHGTVLVRSDIEKMTYYLTPEREKLNRHGVESVRSRVMNLSEAGSEITVEAVKKSFIEATGAEPLNAEPDALSVKKYAELFGSEKWIYGGQK